MLKLSKFFVILSLIIIFGMGTAIAEIDPVCENEVGAAYGSCHAYFTAMDCEGEPQASDVACQKVKDKYTQVTGNANLPCEQPPLPPCQDVSGFCTDIPCDQQGTWEEPGFCPDNQYCCGV